jgi:NAD(P) transhydrogenase subunit alpha
MAERQLANCIALVDELETKGLDLLDRLDARTTELAAAEKAYGEARTIGAVFSFSYFSRKKQTEQQVAEAKAAHAKAQAGQGEAEKALAAGKAAEKKLVAAKHEVIVQSGAGVGASVPDAAYEAVGAVIGDAAATFGAELVLKVRRPSTEELMLMKPGTAIVGILEPFDRAGLEQMAGLGMIAFALEAAPRTTRAQSMDVLSSQANIAGYKAVMVAANTYQRFMPMLMTAAGTVKAARVVILGVGVAGLQAIATAKRLGAVIEASDVRPPVKEQVESLGGKFIDVPYETDEEREIAKGVGGYARPMPESWMKRQAAAVAERVRQADIVITTALIPGRKAPVLVSEDMVKSMKPGSVIVDMAVEQGGNCPLSEPGRTVTRYGVHIVGETNLPALVAADASALYARNVIDFLKLVVDADGRLKVDLEDDIVKACLVARDGQVLRA